MSGLQLNAKKTKIMVSEKEGTKICARIMVLDDEVVVDDEVMAQVNISFTCAPV